MNILKVEVFRSKSSLKCSYRMSKRMLLKEVKVMKVKVLPVKNFEKVVLLYIKVKVLES